MGDDVGEHVARMDQAAVQQANGNDTFLNHLAGAVQSNADGCEGTVGARFTTTCLCRWQPLAAIMQIRNIVVGLPRNRIFGTSYMKVLLLIAILIVAAPAFSQDESVTVGAIDFYGGDGLDLNSIRAALPLREGDRVSRASKEKMITGLREAIKRVTGHEPSDVEPFCCNDRGTLMIYIGLGGESAGQIRYNPPPRDSVRLPAVALKVYREADAAWLNAMKKGVSGEDDSQGYALSLDPEARSKQLAVHAYVARHAATVKRVLESARDVEQRQIAAEMLGYAGRSREQIRALIRASYDVDDGVRNNAIRALAVISRSSSEATAMIPGECFVDLLNSGVWTDRNKSAALLGALTEQRNPGLLTCLREHAVPSLLEMARWSYPGHADSARLMLGRIAGIDEQTLTGLLERHEVEPIINALTTQNDAANAGHSCRPCAALR